MTPQNKKRAQRIYILVVLLILVGCITQLDFEDLSLAHNGAMYLTMLAMLLLITGTVVSLKSGSGTEEKRNQQS